MVAVTVDDGDQPALETLKLPPGDMEAGDIVTGAPVVVDVVLEEAIDVDVLEVDDVDVLLLVELDVVVLDEDDVVAAAGWVVDVDDEVLDGGAVDVDELEDVLDEVGVVLVDDGDVLELLDELVEGAEVLLEGAEVLVEDVDDVDEVLVGVVGLVDGGAVLDGAPVVLTWTVVEVVVELVLGLLDDGMVEVVVVDVEGEAANWRS